ncbi:DUF2812 domain-containing protein [Ruminococcus sp. CLA-AA-H200]|uniref:DUF2812 domain-containing protein n=1 Tax=Ruminococcus turbiniformis TaxID=2881258 RepID=A0ABS8FYG4_9FIRM|nr:DUF2812 domain-containing protein [Ruminococcus turbiniformis]MCC2254212.1 DUF2812 domain-containing protein [Ruminococcus turbiniformis]
MIKFRLYLNKDKETEWLNSMVRKGWALTGFKLGFYTFSPCEPGEYIYQIDFGDKLYFASEEYRELMSDVGAEIVVLWGWWIILRRKAAEGPFELYTDRESMIEHYTKIRQMLIAVGIIETVCMLMQVMALIQGEMIAVFTTVLLSAFAVGCAKTAYEMEKVISRLKQE